ncbi:MAG: hypothetical protein JO328_02065 [Hyphomicrobiales bacterium]|nr:hypothetical protein [Hyphomicrobiales bacterium]MBV8827536.1 hypothetical protein [Hyphomicrobiales bacterium]
MRVNHSARATPEDPSPVGRAAAHLWSEIERARGERNAADALLSRLAGALELLVDSLPSPEREEYRRRLDELRTGVGAPNIRGGEVYSNVIELFRQAGPREWSVPEIQDALSRRGQPIDDARAAKAVYNTINYFAKTGRLQRISRGRYRVCDLGAALDVADDIGDDGTTRMTEHDN